MTLKMQMKVIEKYGGIIDKLSGDAVMAVFEGPKTADKFQVLCNEMT